MKRLKGTLLATCMAAVLATNGVAQAEDVTFVHDKGFWSEAFQEVTKAAETEAGVKIVETPYATTEQYKAYIQASLAGGDLPDMFTWWTGASFTELVSTGKIAPLDGIWEEMIASGDYDASAADLFRVDGHIYAVPLLLARWVMIYNKEKFAEAGITDEPKTWDELMAAAEKLKAAGITPFNATVHEGWRGFIWFQELLLRTDPAAYNGIHDGSVAYDGDAVRKVFEIWSDLYAKGYFTDPRSNQEIEDFAGGNAGMYLKGEWVVGSLASNGLDTDEIGAFIVPNITEGLPSAVVLEGGPVVVSADSIDRPEVQEAVKFWASVAGANAWSSASGNYLGNTKAAAPNEIIAKISGDMSAAGTAAYLRWWEAVPPDLQGELVAELNRFMLDPTMATAEDVMSRMQALNADYWANQ
ncbi:MAG: extracellular solute-binding protein [Devosia sp.]|uniref:ABC transporter substrate-binding protein n=1 Tax=Devosia sp. TaxID=1871048 RepID=UPI001A0E6EE2|nr:extracellular solute-binding protein [Devosia sp.]MBF0678452.1 extracellular solute-binding protein [Devosia sp.]